MRTLVLFLLVVCTASTIHAQTNPYQVGSDYWFAPIASWDSKSADYRLYIVSSNSTNIHVSLGDTIVRTVAIQANVPTIYHLPTDWIMHSSSVVESKAIHVWADADFFCTELSQNTYSSDGMSLIPSAKLDTQYVVAGYAAKFDGGSTYTEDLPSEFTVAAIQDNTVVTILPVWGDLRLEPEQDSTPKHIGTAKGNQFQVTLNKGQSIQFKSTLADNCDDYDLSGTTISATHPVAVCAGSVCPNIPCDFPYCDHVCEMLPPVSTWGRTYCTGPFDNTHGPHDASTVLLIGSKPNQTIYRYAENFNFNVVYCLLQAPFDQYWRNDIDQPSIWISDDPFLLVQYHNSEAYPDDTDGPGFAAQVVIEPVENYTHKVIVRTADEGTRSYANSINIIVCTDVVSTNATHTRFDGNLLDASSYVAAIDSAHDLYRMTKVAAGLHQIESDSPVWAYAYGYGYDEAYAWPGIVFKESSADVASVHPISNVQVHFVADARTLTVKTDSPASIEIFDLLGAAVLKTTTSGTDVDLTRLTPGVYFYRVTSEGSLTAGKFVIP